MFSPVTLQQLPQNLYQLCQILQQASQILTQQYQLYTQGESFEIQQKLDDSPVTQADLLVNQFLEQALNGLPKVYPILSEEGQNDERKQWTEFWLIDPLDGTKEFIKKTGEFTINLSLIRDGVSVISALAVPLEQRIYIVEQGGLPYRYEWQGEVVNLNQYVNTEIIADKENKILKVAVSRRLRVDSDYSKFLNQLDAQHIQYEKIAAGSAYKFCLMLEGKIDVYPRLHGTSEWDTAAGQGLLQSIGGEIVSLKGKPFLYNQRTSLDNGYFFALRKFEDWPFFQKFFD